MLRVATYIGDASMLRIREYSSVSLLTCVRARAREHVNFDIINVRCARHTIRNYRSQHTCIFD
jgi:hypothetical protein